MDTTIRELSLDKAAHVINFRQQWDLAQVRIITVGGADVGWLQGTTCDDAFFSRRSLQTVVSNARVLALR
jgi:hypothetical protein